jgi:NADH/F420H2 dehydrogenase subunit C
MMAIDRQVTVPDTHGKHFNRSFLESVRRHGRVFEMGMMVAYKLRTFDFLSDVTGVDRLNLPENSPRFEVVYHVYSIQHGRRLRLKVRVDEGQAVPTVTEVWPTANWHEREVSDLFGVPFAGHPDLRRILMPDDWEGHPLRKDYPVEASPRWWEEEPA